MFVSSINQWYFFLAFSQESLTVMTDGVLVKLQFFVAEMFNWVKKKKEKEGN